jgi:Putative porin
LFYPRLRFENTTSYSTNNFLFHDVPASNTSGSHDPYASGDSAFFQNNYDTTLIGQRKDSLVFQDTWRRWQTDFSFYAFPDAKNLQQFFKGGVFYEFLNGTLKNGTAHSFTNLMLHGEYRNRTKNQKWDVLAFGRLYLSGYNSGDYHAYISLQRLLSSKFGSLQVGFENVNRRPSFIFDPLSNFHLDSTTQFSKENTIHFFGSVVEPRLGLQLSADYYLLSNYSYIENYYHFRQISALFNFLRISALKTFHLARHLNLHSEFYIQQKTGNVPIHYPTFYTRNQFAFEGNFFRNLNIATGVEVKYNTPYMADRYSPVLGRFFYQDSVTINNLPEVNAFLNFRIRSFKAYVRLENLNSASLTGGFGFNNNNLAAPYYPMPGMVFRFGINWDFVN